MLEEFPCQPTRQSAYNQDAGDEVVEGRVPDVEDDGQTGKREEQVNCKDWIGKGDFPGSSFFETVQVLAQEKNKAASEDQRACDFNDPSGSSSHIYSVCLFVIFTFTFHPGRLFKSLPAFIIGEINQTDRTQTIHKAKAGQLVDQAG